MLVYQHPRPQPAGASKELQEMRSWLKRAKLCRTERQADRVAGQLEALLLAGPAVIDRPDSNGDTPLLLVAKAFDASPDAVPLLLALLAMGADAGAADAAGNTPLHVAARLGSVALAVLLLKQPIDVGRRNAFGSTPVHLAACSRGGARVLKVLLEGHAAAVIDVPDAAGATPLHLAAEMGHAETVGLLLRHGADPSLPNQLGKTPRQLAWGAAAAAFDNAPAEPEN